jgi:hypothetical protein
VGDDLSDRLCPIRQREDGFEPEVGAVDRRHRPSLVLRTGDAESRGVALEAGRPRTVRCRTVIIGPDLPVRTIEADEGSIDARSACDVARRRGALEAPAMQSR